MKLFNLLVCIMSIFGMPVVNMEEYLSKHKVDSKNPIELVYINENDDFMFRLFRIVKERLGIKYFMCARKTTDSDRNEYSKDSKCEGSCPDERIVIYNSKYKRFYNYNSILKDKSIGPVIAFVKLKETDYVKEKVSNFHKYYLAVIDSLENTSAEKISDVKINPVDNNIYCLNYDIFFQCKYESEIFYYSICRKTFDNEHYKLGLELYEDLCYLIDFPSDEDFLKIVCSGKKYTYNHQSLDENRRYVRKEILDKKVTLRVRKKIYDSCIEKLIDFDAEVLFMRPKDEIVFRLCKHVLRHKCVVQYLNTFFPQKEYTTFDPSACSIS